MDNKVLCTINLSFVNKEGKSVEKLIPYPHKISTTNPCIGDIFDDMYCEITSPCYEAHLIHPINIQINFQS